MSMVRMTWGRSFFSASQSWPCWSGDASHWNSVSAAPSSDASGDHRPYCGSAEGFLQRCADLDFLSHQRWNKHRLAFLGSMSDPQKCGTWSFLHQRSVDPEWGVWQILCFYLLKSTTISLVLETSGSKMLSLHHVDNTSHCFWRTPTCWEKPSDM